MTRADNTRYLRAAATARHEQALQRAHDAIRTLDRRGEPITFAAVAATAHVSRTWLYQQPHLRTAITTHRHPRPTPTTTIPAAQRATTQSTTARLDTLRAEIEHLRNENAILRDHVARALGQRRTQPDPPHQQHVQHTEHQHTPDLPVARSR